MKQNISVPLFLAAALAIAGALPAESQLNPADSTTNTLTLEAAVRLALENNPDVNISQARVRAASGRARQSGKWSNPELELSAEDWPVNRGNGFSDAKQLIGISQVLPFPGKKSLARKAGSAGVKLAGAELALRRTEIVRNVKGAFYRVLAAENQMNVSARLASVAESAAAAARQRVDAGDAALQEQLRAEMQSEQARTELAGRQRDLATARQVLATLLGRPETSLSRLAGTLNERPGTALLADGPDDWLTRHPSTVAAQASADRAELEARRARLEKYPDVKFSVAGGRIGASDESVVQVGASIPLPVLDQGQGRESEARANTEAAQSELLAVRQQLRHEWFNARERYRTASEQVARYRERMLPKAEEALRLVQTGFEQGKLGFIDLLDTQRTDAEVHLAYQEKLLELNLAHAELEALLQPESILFPNPKQTTDHE